jgi:hypothetical protein
VLVLVAVFVGVAVLVTVYVGVLGLGVFVTVNVLVAVNVGVQHSTSAVTQLELTEVFPALPIKAWFDMGLQPVTLPHQVNEPVWFETEPMFHVTGDEDEHPLQLIYVTPVGTSSFTNALSVTLAS